jgi:simple sugar transport system ATP-binding protein
VCGLAPAAAQARGAIAFVPQHPLLFPAFTVGENVMTGHQPRRAGGFLHRARSRDQARAALAAWHLDGYADLALDTLDQVQRKVVEICRALLTEPEVLLLDEPTAGLDRADAERLFNQLDRLRDRGVTLVYVSHHLHEIYRVCDSITVLRDARHVRTDAAAELPVEALVAAMVGDGATPPARPATGTAPASRGTDGATNVTATDGRVALEARRLSASGGVTEVSLSVRAGECLGVAGIDGSGKLELADALVGRRPASGGELLVGGRPVRLRSVADAHRHGIGFVPAERHVDGMVTALDVSENATMSALPRLARRPAGIGPRLVRRAYRDELFTKLQRQWRIVASSPRQLIGELSGGNQQKCVLARALATEPDVLVLVNPTAGVDVQAKASISASLARLLALGTAMLIVSEDADDFALCERIVVMGHGRVATELHGSWDDRLLTSAIQEAAA